MTQRSRPNPDAPELAALRRRLEGDGAAGGPRLWRSLDELAETEEFLRYLHREFPEQASEWHDPVGRRQFLRVMAASLVLAGVSGCVVRPGEHIVPYVQQPPEVVPGKPIFFATAAPLGGFGTGVTVESHTGRPTKVEGNPDHPASLGATDAFAQAQVLTLYDPDRAQVVTRNARVSTWDDFTGELIDRREALAKKGGEGLRILTGTITSPTLARQLADLLGSEEFGKARWHQFEPVGPEGAAEGARLAFGEPLDAVYDLTKADVIVSLDSDFLHWGPGRLRYARQFAQRREPGEGNEAINRLYVVEPTPTITGAMADHRVPLRHEEVAAAALALARAVGVEGTPAGRPLEAEWVAGLADDLKAHRGRSVVLVGETQPPAVHALGHAINAALGNVGQAVRYVEPVAARPPEGQGGTIVELAADLRAGKVDTLLILGGNPAYTAPADLEFGALLTEARQPGAAQVQLIYHGLYPDETAQKCQWHIPAAHFLESWGDIRAFDGTATIQQPLIEPLHEGVEASRILHVLRHGTDVPSRSIVEETWRGDRDLAAFERFWAESLRSGVVADTASKPREAPAVRPLGELAWPQPSPAVEGLSVLFRPDPTVWDGQFTNNAWLQELPKPLTRITWDNAVLMSLATAEKLGLKDEDVVELTAPGVEAIVKAPVYRLPGQADGVVTLHLGYGRPRFAGRVGNGTGFNAYALRTSSAPWAAGGLGVKATGARYQLASVQMHHNMAGRHLVRAGTVEEFAAHPAFAEEGHPSPQGHTDPPEGLTIFEHPEPQRRREEGYGNAWGMAINLNTCIGCSACVVACQAENNIPVVGKAQVLAGREMHWIRIDRYYQTAEPEDVNPWSAAAANPKTYFQPVPCMHCENAPCELVCPVAATTHSAEGLNEMTYNRCVGTRYCSNNCPYKVRRFNFLHFQEKAYESPLLRMVMNPDVTVRFRGVMEKCTYCVQRVNNARIASEIRGEERVPGDAVVTACAQACPTRAIVFGNLNDESAEVVKHKASPRNYSLLGELNTRPRTTYLARLYNPNAALGAEGEGPAATASADPETPTEPTA
jgi:molybdopterin-containing oxidoreductase family iron-sulfur binding subunit